MHPDASPAADPRLAAEIAAQPHRFVYATLVGPHLYGLHEPDESLDVRGCHLLPAREVVGLRTPVETVAYTAHRDGLDLELVSHDLRKLCLLLLKKNGNVLEHVLSPLVVHTSPEHEELAAIARGCPSTHMAHHFLSHAAMHWSLFVERKTARALLLAVRVLLTAAHLLATGEFEADLSRLTERFGLRWIDDVRARGGTAEPERWAAEFERLQGLVHDARTRSPLPAQPPESARERLDALLVRLRLGRDA